MVTRRADSKERLPTATVAREANGCRGRPAQGRSPCMEQGHVRAEDPEGGVQRRATRCSGGWEVVSTCVPGGWWSAAGVTATRGEMHGQDRVLFLCENKATRPRVSPYLWASVYNWYTDKHKHKLCWCCPSPVVPELGQSAGSAP